MVKTLQSKTFITIMYISIVPGVNMIRKSVQVSSSKAEGGTARIKMGGFKPGTKVNAVLIGWDFTFQSPTPRPIKNISILTQQAVSGDWVWARDFDVNSNGGIDMRYVANIRDDNGDDPYDFTIICMLIGD